MMNVKEIARTMVPLLAVSLAALPTYAQDAAPQSAQPAASKQVTKLSYQCAVKTKDAGVEKMIIRAASEKAAKSAAVKKVGSRSTGLAGVSCVSACRIGSRYFERIGTERWSQDASGNPDTVRSHPRRSRIPTRWLMPTVATSRGEPSRCAPTLSIGPLLQGSDIRMSGEVLRNAQMNAQLPAPGVPSTPRGS